MKIKEMRKKIKELKQEIKELEENNPHKYNPVLENEIREIKDQISFYEKKIKKRKNYIKRLKNMLLPENEERRIDIAIEKLTGIVEDQKEANYFPNIPIMIIDDKRLQMKKVLFSHLLPNSKYFYVIEDGKNKRIKLNRFYRILGSKEWKKLDYSYLYSSHKHNIEETEDNLEDLDKIDL